MKLSDGLLESALTEISCEELAQLPSDEELAFTNEVPKRFDRKILRLIRENRFSPWERKVIRYSKRVALFFLALLIAAGTTIMTVSAAREWFFKVVSQIFPTHTEIRYAPEESEQSELPFVVYAPMYLPDGYVADEEPQIREASRLVRTRYANEAGGSIVVSQKFQGALKIDTEDAKTGTVEVNGQEALYVEKGDTRMLLWNIDNAYFLIHASDDNLNKANLLAIAESIAPLEPTK